MKQYREQCKALCIVSTLAINLLGLNGLAADYSYELTPNESGLKKHRQVLAPICQQMKSDILPQIQYLQELRTSLQKIWRYADVPEYADKINYLLAQIQKVSIEIEKLSRPDWNAEVWDLNLQWTLPREQFFPSEKEFQERALEIRRRIISENLESHRDLDGRIHIRPKMGSKKKATAQESAIIKHVSPFQFVNLKVDEMYFMGAHNEAIQQYFTYYLPSLSFDDVKISYKKKATALEICQLLTTLQVAITINHTQLRPDFSGEVFVMNTRLYLVVAEKDVL